MTKPKRVYISLTENELIEVINAVGHYKTVLKAQAARKQSKFGYRDNSPSRKRASCAITAQRKLTSASRNLRSL